MKTGLRCGERLVRCLSGGDVDRVPFGVNFGWNPWTETLANWRRELGRPELDVADEFGYDAGFACPSLESGPLPHFEPLTISETAEHVVTGDWRGVTQRNRRDGGSIPEFLDYPVKTDRGGKSQGAEKALEGMRCHLHGACPFVRVALFVVRPWCGLKISHVTKLALRGAEVNGIIA